MKVRAVEFEGGKKAHVGFDSGKVYITIESPKEDGQIGDNGKQVVQIEVSEEGATALQIALNDALGVVLVRA